MPNVVEELKTCLDELSLEYEIEEIDYIPQAGKKKKTHLPVWRLLIQAEINGLSTNVDLYLVFPNGFPYEMPYAIVPDNRFKILPHISTKDRKVCLYEDGITCDAKNIRVMIRDAIKRTRLWLEKYASCDNTAEYAREIISYWNEQYDGETDVDGTSVFFGDIPASVSELKGLVYTIRNPKNNKDCVQQVFYSLDDDSNEIKFLSENYDVHKIAVLYLPSIVIPVTPPFSLTGKQLVDTIRNQDDKKVFRRFINKYGSGYVLFPIGLNHVLGGVFIGKQALRRRGFSHPVETYEVLTEFEGKVKKISRLSVYKYNGERIAERTAGQMMEENKIVIAGVGSVGSNLCYYLNGYNNARFTLIDTDSLNIENIGRHLLGYSCLNQSKAYAVAHYLKQYRPDREVTAITESVLEVSLDIFNEGSVIFLCTGDIMTEKWLLDKMISKEIITPAFIFWLEPYAVSGIMIYVNPADEVSLAHLAQMADDSFLDLCLIDREEYASGQKLIHRDAGCNGMYALYSANDVTFFLSAMFPLIDELLTIPSESKCYQWSGNIEIAEQKGIRLSVSSEGMKKNDVTRLQL